MRDGKTYTLLNQRQQQCRRNEEYNEYEEAKVFIDVVHGSIDDEIFQKLRGFNCFKLLVTMVTGS